MTAVSTGSSSDATTFCRENSWKSSTFTIVALNTESLNAELERRA